jgi:DNA-binding GntR family transcriptional regulator
MAHATARSKMRRQRPQSLADAAYASIEEMIVSRRLAPGAMVSESQLCEELGVGRTPVREALARLKHIGFVDVHARRGVLVTGVDIFRHLELLEVRRPLEECVVRCAAERADANDLEELQRLSHELAEAAKTGDRIRYFRMKRSIHDTEVHAAHNQVLTVTMRALHAQSRRFWYTYEPADSFPRGAKLHGAVAHGLVKRDAESAVAAVAALFEFLERLTRNALDRRPPA